MKLLRLLRKVKNSFTRYEPSVKVLISKEKLLENLHEYQKNYPNFLFAPTLKSNAYGHGLVPVAEILDTEQVAFLVLDSLYEAMILRSNGIKSELLIIGYTQVKNIKHSKLSGVAFTITSLEQLEEVAVQTSSRVTIHLKVDTGMHRQGILPEQIHAAIEIINNHSHLVLEGVCSHFADADNEDDAFTQTQIKQWKNIVETFSQNFSSIKFFHIAATAGVAHSAGTAGNVVRLGIGLYGINVSVSPVPLKPVLQMQSIISSVKRVRAGEHIGYNLTYTALRDSMIATVPAGYCEGVSRKLSNCGFFKIGDSYCPIVGNVSMNITSIDVTSIPQVKMGDVVTILSDTAADKNSVLNIASLTQTIPWEVLVSIPQHLRRVVM